MSALLNGAYVQGRTQRSAPTSRIPRRPTDIRVGLSDKVAIDERPQFLSLDPRLPTRVELTDDPFVQRAEAGIVFAELDAEMLLDQEDQSRDP
jgi:hypothetical protein